MFPKHPQSGPPSFPACLTGEESASLSCRGPWPPPFFLNSITTETEVNLNKKESEML